MSSASLVAANAALGGVPTPTPIDHDGEKEKIQNVFILLPESEQRCSNMRFVRANQVVSQGLVVVSLLVGLSSCSIGVRRTVFYTNENDQQTLTKSYKPQLANTTASNKETGCGRVPLYEKLYHRSIKSEDSSGDTQEDPGDFRILYGDDAEFGEWPWVVKLEACNAKGCSSCTGSLLNSRWIITAGHCFSDGNATDRIRAKIGLYDLLVPDEGSFSVELDRIVLHPNYHNLDNDLTLLKTRKPIEFNDNVQPVCLVDLGRADKDGVDYARKRKCYTIGYGLKSDLFKAIRLQKLEITARDSSECDNDLSGVKLRNGSMCIGPVQGKIGGSCRGDSGGPNQCYDGATNRWYLFSVVSYGPADCDREEADKWLTVSVDLTKYQTWISSIIWDI